MRKGIFAVTCAIFMMAIGLVYGEEVFISDLTPVSSFVHNGLKVDVDYYSETIKMDGVEYEKGIVMHVESPQGYSEVIYNIDSKFRTFRAEIGLSHRDAPAAGSVIFFVYIDDGKGEWIEIYKSEEVIKHETPTIQLELDISEASSQLRLYCTDAGDGNNSDHATFANAFLDTKSVSGLAVGSPGKMAVTWGEIKSR